jgi:hypothetical protein
MTTCMTVRVGVSVVVLSLVLWVTLGADRVEASDGSSAALMDSRTHLRRALATQATTRTRLRVLGDAWTCVEARFVSYRQSDVVPSLVDAWYVASQLWADAELLQTGPVPTGLSAVAQVPARPTPARPPEVNLSEERCHLELGFIFLDRLWDYAQGGYFPQSDPTGTEVPRGPRFTDDAAVAGLALLATADTLPDGDLRRHYRYAARRVADFLIVSGLWDETFGGGFWWNTTRGDSDEGKPAQSNALAALFFARLYAAAGDEGHRTWARRTLLWLDTVLYDPDRQLYRWSIRYEQPAERAGGAVTTSRYFNYDQGVAVEAQLAVGALDRDPGHLARAQRVGEALHREFWDHEHGGYRLEAGVAQVFTAYAALASLGHLALHAADGDARWRDMALMNAEALATVLGEEDGGYALRHYRCVRRDTPGCEAGDVTWAIDHTRDTAAHAWPQHLETAIARSLAGACPSHGGRAISPHDHGSPCRPR